MSRECSYCGRVFPSRTAAIAHEREHQLTDPACRWPGKPAGMADMEPIVRTPVTDRERKAA